MLGHEINVSHIEVIGSYHCVLEVTLIQQFYLDLSLLNILHALQIFLDTFSSLKHSYRIRGSVLTTFLGSKNKCSFQIARPVEPISSFAVVNFFSFMTCISMIGSIV